MKKLEFTGKIKVKDNNDIIQYHDKDFREKLEKWKSENSGSDIIISFESIDVQRHGQFKYYFGFLLPDAAFLYGESDKEYHHRYSLKRRHLFTPVESFMEIPARYREKAVIYTQIKPVYENGEPVMVNNNEVKLKESIVGYAPSLADISNDERAEFIKVVELEFFEDQGGHIGETKTNRIDLEMHSKNAKKFRDMGNGVEHEQGLFDAEVDGIEPFDSQIKFGD